MEINNDRMLELLENIQIELSGIKKELRIFRIDGVMVKK